MKPTMLLRLYPRAWRERYGDEVLVLIEQSRDARWRLTVDLLCGCVGVWMMTATRSLSPKARREWLKVYAASGAIVIGNVLSGALALTVPSAPHLGHWIADWSRLTVLIAMVVFLFRIRHLRSAGRLTQMSAEVTALAVIIVVNGAIIRAYGTWTTPSSLAAWRAGAETWLGFMWSGSGSAIAPFYLLGAALAPLLWPRAFAAVDDTVSGAEA